MGLERDDSFGAERICDDATGAIRGSWRSWKLTGVVRGDTRETCLRARTGLNCLGVRPDLDIA